ncbi:MAG: glycosyltransferase family 2 protein [Clostridiales bacterium]|nr:glycosyltransferase family 2 protein [Clostridiales bacterium]
MMTISLCMIVKNEEAVLARCLDSVQKAVDEIVLVDTGSTDATKEIAARYTDRVYDFPWVDDFSAARNFAFEKATMDYQLWLDADDLLAPAECEKLLRLKQTLPADTDIVTMPYHVSFDAEGNLTMSSVRGRLFLRSGGHRWQDPVHEFIPQRGKLYASDIVVTHRRPPREGGADRNLNIYQRQEALGRPFTPRQLYYYARELRDHGRHEEAVLKFEAFLSGGGGWVEDNLAACHALALCLRALGRRRKSEAALLRSFTYDAPRAEALCELGYHWKEQRDYRRAAAWFSLALQARRPAGSGFLLHDYWGFIPHIELSVCRFMLGEFEPARAHNELAAGFKPQHPAVLANRAFFEKHPHP